MNKNTGGVELYTHSNQSFAEDLMKKIKDEKELLKKAIELGIKYGENRGVVEFEATDSASEKIEYIYRLLVHDKVIQPIPEDQVSQKSMKHKLAIWASKQ
jgi:hypothetical protein